MSILNVNTIQPVGSGQTITVSATNISAPSTVVTAGSFVGNVTGSVSGGSFSGISTAGITTVYTNSINNGQLGGSRNIIINGSMVVNQRGWTGAAGTTISDSYITDRFTFSHSHDGAVSAGQTSMNSTVGGNAYADGFRNALIFRVTTADSSLAAGQYQYITQTIEGYNVQGIKKGTANAQPVTLSFWVRSNTTGTYIAELYDNDNTRQVSQAYTINAANTWEKKALTFPADTTGAFDNDNALSLYAVWWLAAGSTFSGGTLNTSWAANTNANRAVGQTNLLATAGNDFFLTGVQLEVGDRATEFERRSYGQELALCRRYYKKGLAAQGNSNASFFSSYYGGTSGVKTFDIDMPSFRAAPNLSLLNNSNFQYYSYAGAWTNTTLTVTAIGTWPNMEIYFFFSADGDGRGKLARCTNATDIHWVTDAEL